MDPSGTYLQFDAKAIGSGSEGAQQSLQEIYHKVKFLSVCFSGERIFLTLIVL
jgi:20S proteasome subunit alpha 5